jgi:adenine-specific DNA-methyltransferase
VAREGLESYPSGWVLVPRAVLRSGMTVSRTDPQFSDAPENAFADRVERSRRRSLGQFFTPYAVARFMARWVVGNPSVKTILDPAVGLGVFFRAASEVAEQELHFVGYDVDPLVLDKASRLLADCVRATLRERDFLRNDWEGRFDGILCNPPYQRFQNYPERARTLTEFASRLNVELSGYTNLYALFLLKGVAQLAAGGRAAFIVPSEFLNTGYGERIKAFLLGSGALRYVLVFDFGSNVFDRALTTACLLLFANDGRNAPVEFLTIRSVEDLASLEPVLAEYPNARRIGNRVAAPDPTAKWRVYYQPSATATNGLVPLSTYGRVVRGIATGHNDFFALSEPQRRRLGISERFVLPCLTKATHARSSLFTDEDFARLRDGGKKVWLLNVGDTPDAAVRAYLRHGEATGVHQRYLTRHRSPWYAIEKRTPAPVLVTVFGRGGVRFVRNEAPVWNLTCFHGWNLDGLEPSQVDLLMAYLLTNVAQEVVAGNRREYGDGLEKFEPNDPNDALVLDVNALTEETASDALRLYDAYLRSVRRGAPDESRRVALDALFRAATT